MFSEDPILLPEIVDQIVLVTVHPASEREDEELQRRRHSLRLLGRLDQHRPSLGRFFAPYGVRNHPLLRDLDLPPLGGDSSRAGPLVTKTLLIYALTAGGSNDGPRLVAFDKATGEEVASVDLPGGAIGTPMTYMLDGKQYVSLTVGGRRVPQLIALALP